MSAQDVTTGALRVTGLRQAAENLAKLSAETQTSIMRAAVWAGLDVVRKAAAGATYTTFKRRAGAIGRGFGIAVAREPSGTELIGALTQDLQAAAGLGRVFKGTRKRGQPRALPVDYKAVAYWWRFLEFGTGPRRAMRMPGKRASAARLAKYQASANRGAIASRSWVRPATSGSAQAAVDAFDKKLRERIEATPLPTK